MWSNCGLVFLSLSLASFLPGQIQQSLRTTPGQVCGLKDVVAVAAGGIGGLAVKSDGTVWEWYGQSAPAQVAELSDVVSVAAGIGHYMALKRDGTVWEWPGPWIGPVPAPPTLSRTPYQIGEMTDVVAIAAGETRSVAVKRDGTVWEWTRPTVGFQHVGAEGPSPVGNLDGVVAASIAYEAWWDALLDSRTLALKGDGTVWVWNRGTWARGGVTPIGQLTGVVAITAGPAGDLALKGDGTVWQWDDRLIPAQVSGLDGVVAVANGSYGSGFLGSGQIAFALALKSDGTVWEWGGGLTRSTILPVQVEGISDVVRIAAAGVYSYTSGMTPAIAAVKRDGTVWWWGETWNVRLSNGTGCDEGQPLSTSSLRIISHAM